jgi:glycosyltransferase involved in cell wall biosynthesis
VSLDRVVDLCARSAVFCMPSKMEASGVVFLEAMAAGLPVIALRLGAAPDFVIDGETGITVRPDDVAVLADAMCRLLDDPEECRRLGENGRRLVMEKYTWDHVCADMACRMREVVGR